MQRITAEHKVQTRVRKLQAVVNTLREFLENSPGNALDGDALSRLLHSASEKLHKTEIELCYLGRITT
jgi:hypothetical protein